MGILRGCIMVRYNNATVDIYEEGKTTNDEGDIIADFTKVASLIGDVQSYKLTESDVKLYGIDTKSAAVKRFFYNGYCASVKPGNRAVVTSAYTGLTETYSIMPINAWERHGECLLVPVENE